MDNRCDLQYKCIKKRKRKRKEKQATFMMFLSICALYL